MPPLTKEVMQGVFDAFGDTVIQSMAFRLALEKRGYSTEQAIDAINNALKDVSAAQGEARAMAQNFSAGDPNVNLQDVMVNLQKANLSFQQMVQVRNRLVTAYQDIMNMPV